MPGRKKATKCKWGHDLTLPDARNKWGHCVLCQADRNERRREREKARRLERGPIKRGPHPQKGTCRNGHDLAIVGRYGDDGQCRQCVRDRTKDQSYERKASPVWEVQKKPMPIPGLKEIRERMCVSVELLAAASGLLEDTIREYESGKVEVPPKTRLLIWHALQWIDAATEQEREYAVAIKRDKRNATSIIA